MENVLGIVATIRETTFIHTAQIASVGFNSWGISVMGVPELDAISVGEEAVENHPKDDAKKDRRNPKVA